ncbi:MAG: alpha-hydroxy acid oxidase [Blastococcus sp.]
MVERRIPRWSELSELIRPRRLPGDATDRRLARAATVGDLREIARRQVPRAVFDYTDGAAGAEISLSRSRAAFERIEFHPSVLRDVSVVDTGTSILGEPASLPLAFAPTGFTRLMHTEGESAVGRVAERVGVPYALSTMGTTSLEALAAAAPGARRWFQLYLWRDRGASAALVERARVAGYEALVLTVDASVRAQREAERRAGFRLPDSIAAVNLPPERPAPATLAERLAQAPTWNDVTWLQAQTRLPVLLKGILHPADARLAVDAGVQGVIVSNHGGRTLAAAAATPTALPAIVEAVDGAMPVLVDGGIRDGTDVLRALALGADAVLMGRPVLWALATAGAAGAAHALRLLRDELALAMAQCGVAQPRAASRDLLVA